MENVEEKLKVRGEGTKQIFLPHCTWDKFGDILAHSGGRCMGLFDEIVSYFATMKMYSSNKMQVSDTKEYQDFLQMYTGKTKSRETGTAISHLYHFFQYYSFLLNFSHWGNSVNYFKVPMKRKFLLHNVKQLLKL